MAKRACAGFHAQNHAAIRKKGKIFWVVAGMAARQIGAGTDDMGQAMLIYGLKNCDTCRKALKALQTAGHDAELVDVRAEPLDAAILQAFYAEFGDALLNTRSTTWRSLSETERTGAPVDLIAAHPALMKRPVIRAEDGRLYLGWGAEVQAALS